MITIRNRSHAAAVFRHLRVGQGLTRRQLAERLWVSEKTIGNRERQTLAMSTEVLIDTAHALGHTVALLPNPRPGTRGTGTGWPA